jgi:hypothetical protein
MQKYSIYKIIILLYVIWAIYNSFASKMVVEEIPIGILKNSASYLKIPPPSEEAFYVRFHIEVPSDLDFFFERNFVGLVLKDEKNRRVITEKSYSVSKYTSVYTSVSEYTFDLSASKLSVFLNTDTPYYVRPLFKNNENKSIKIDAEVVVSYFFKG